jgi:hypothetical protein
MRREQNEKAHYFLVVDGAVVSRLVAGHGVAMSKLVADYGFGGGERI